MSYNINDVGYGAALGYFPAKVLELIDVFDSMTDERKKYRRSAFSPEEAVQAMRNDFLDGSYPGVDPILYNIFIDFLNVSGIISSGSGISRESLKI
jgi:HD-GYP domain-containing protein (c-di-GMP phosphodiesterase class II)